MIYVYFFIKFNVKWSNSVRFEKNLQELAARWAKFCEILSHTVRCGMYEFRKKTREVKILNLKLQETAQIGRSFISWKVLKYLHKLYFCSF